MTELTEYHHHEALHASSMVLSIVEEHIMEHPAVSEIPKRKELADKAHQALFDLYQLIGSQHIGAQEDD